MHSLNSITLLLCLMTILNVQRTYVGNSKIKIESTFHYFESESRIGEGCKNILN
jgi:hypothetical protein